MPTFASGQDMIVHSLLCLITLITCVYGQCTERQLRLVETPNIGINERFDANNAGRLEVCFNGQWGTIAADSLTTPWSEKNAQVACRQLGFSGALNSILQNTVTTVDRTGDSVAVHYSSVVCNGTEGALEECARDIRGFANHIFDVFIVCRPSEEISEAPYSDLHIPGPNPGDIRLLGSPDNGAGAVEIYTDNVGWTGICPDSSWTDEDAGVVCRALGYDSGLAQTFEIVDRFLLIRQAANVECTDDRQSRAGFVSAGVCSLSLTGSCSARVDSFAGVVCSSLNSSLPGSVRLYGGGSDRFGIVEVLYDGRWGVVCDRGFGYEDAAVVCAELGIDRLTAGLLTLESRMSLLSRESTLKPIWLANISCSSSESQLSQCQRDSVVGWSDCRFYGVAAVNCSTCGDGELRLVETSDVNSLTNNAGRLEVCFNGQWGTIAADSFATPWSEKNALVACRQLGFSGALNSIFQNTITEQDRASSSVPVHYSGVVCDGTEGQLEDCSLNGVSGSSSSRHNNDVFIVCRPTRVISQLNYSDLHIPGPNAGDIRLLGSPDNGAGAVEIYTDNVGWTGICPDTSWTNQDAGVVCRALGYDSGLAQTFSLVPGAISLRQASRAQCNANNQVEIGFISAGVCSLSLTGSCSARVDSYAGVVCSPPSSLLTGSIRLFGGDYDAVGILEVLYDGRWGVVCDRGFLITEARVVCGEMGYKRDDTVIIRPFIVSSSLTRASATYTELLSRAMNETSLEPLWLSDIECLSSATTLSECQLNKPIGSAPCAFSNLDYLVALQCGEKEESVLRDPLVIIAFVVAGLGACALVVVLFFGVGYYWEEHKKKSRQTRVAMETRTSAAASNSKSNDDARSHEKETSLTN